MSESELKETKETKKHYHIPIEVIETRGLRVLAIVVFGTALFLQAGGSSMINASAMKTSSVVQSEKDTKDSEKEEIKSENNEVHSNIDAKATQKIKSTGFDFKKASEKKDAYDADGVKVGKMVQMWADSKEVTDDLLADWYYNYLCKQDVNYGVILYADGVISSDSVKGVIATNGYVMKDTILQKDYGSFAQWRQDITLDYTIYNDYGTLVKEDGYFSSLGKKEKKSYIKAVKDILDGYFPDTYELIEQNNGLCINVWPKSLGESKTYDPVEEKVMMIDDVMDVSADVALKGYDENKGSCIINLYGDKDKKDWYLTAMDGALSAVNYQKIEMDADGNLYPIDSDKD